MDIEPFRTVIDYCRYRPNNHAAYIYPDTDLSRHKVKRKIDLLFPDLEAFSWKVDMEMICFLLTIKEAFDVQRVSGGIASRALGFFLTGSSRTAYTKVIYRITRDPNHLPVTWALIVHYLLDLFITDDLLCKEHYAATSIRIK